MRFRRRSNPVQDRRSVTQTVPAVRIDYAVKDFDQHGDLIDYTVSQNPADVAVRQLLARHPDAQIASVREGLQDVTTCWLDNQKWELASPWR